MRHDYCKQNCIFQHAFDMESKMLPDSLLHPAFSVLLPINGANIHSMAGEIVWCASTCLLELVKTIWQIICTLWTDIISIL